MTHPIGVIDGIFAGTDPHAVYALQLSEIAPPHIPAIPEMPAVGPHATKLGKVVASMGLPFELRTYGWQLQRGSRITSADQRRARAHQHSIIQALVDVAQDTVIPEVAIRVMGPVDTIIHGMLPSGQRILRDPVARQDIAAAWADALTNMVDHIDDVVGAKTTVLVSEQSAHEAVNGKIRSVSGADVERALDLHEVRTMWEQAAQLDATVILEPTTQLITTAADFGSIGIAWPTARNQQTEETWQLVDGLITKQHPVALHLPGPAEDPEHYAEELIHQYTDWGLNPEGLEHIRLIHRVSGGSQTTVGAGLEWFRTVVEHAGGYATTL